MQTQTEDLEHAEPLVRTFSDLDGRTWHAYVVLARTRWEESGGRCRRNWLCIEAGSDRRYVTPVPEGWEHWTERELEATTRRAKPDLRR